MIGRSLSHYRIAEELGQGGMGTVYRARDERLGRDVAIKILTSDLGDDPQARSKLRKEARALARVNHPGICAVYDIDSQDGCDFLVMEYVSGGTLGDRFRRAPLSEREALGVAIEIAEALAAAHDEGVIHNDLKPDNVLVTARGALKVSDFGLARRIQTLKSSLTPMTSAAVPGVAGTLPYMAPEVLLEQDPTPRSDIYALGVILYEAVSSRRPFEGATAAGLTAEILTGDAAPLRRLRPEASPGLEAVVIRCLAKDPDQRFASASELVETLRSLAAVPAGPEGATADVSSPLSSEPTSFVGRVRELRECGELLRSARLLSLVGPGGSGKTRLALRLMAVNHTLAPGGAWFVDLAPVSDPSHAALAIAVGLSLPDSGGQTPAEAIPSFLRSRAGLLVLDNCEEVVTAITPLLTALLATESRTRVLTTSRVPLHVQGEQLFHVPPLSVPGDGAADAIEAVKASDAGRLFVERATAVKPGFTLTADNAAAIADICRELDGIPLALELAAGRLKVLSAAQIRERLSERFRLLARPEAGDLQRHRTLLETLVWSYEALDDDLKGVLRALSVFAGGCTLGAAAFVLGDATDEYRLLDQLSQLIDMSLLTASGADAAETRYSMLETVRQFARDRMLALGEAAAARDRHLRFFLALAEQANPKLNGVEERLWVDRLAAEHANLLSAHAWCDEAQDGAESGLRLTWALERYWYIRGELTLGRHELERALKRPGAGVPAVVRGRALYGAGDLASFMGDAATARTHLEEALVYFREFEDETWLGRVLLGLGNTEVAAEDLDRARNYYEESLAIFRRVGHPRAEPLILGNLAEILRIQGNLREARAHCLQAVERLRLGNDRHGWALTVTNLSAVSTELGLLRDARDELLEALGLIDELGAKRAGAYALEAAGELAVAMDDPWAAAEFYGAASSLREQISSPLSKADASARQIRVALTRDRLGATDYERAAARGRHLSFAEAIARAINWTTGLSPGA